MQLFSNSVIELEKSRQANIQNYFESIEKKIRVENIRVCFQLNL